ncbi:ribosomal protection-like ABC-F family protein [Halobacillus sp. Marseille-Q1614]|uniref:ribosomal protection-like ABC-F family protein n=1 Tax=Halobacillus sp. Marseille-Q1614 TaxID=2709134 RepID=UPI00156EE6FB|nr:ABC-F family ATP-binding cassette domain-containing protein [Halobacillus sp. Marseille-Q1614]
MYITLKDAYKIIGGKVLFESLNFEIDEGQKIGLVGRNGSGKTTIFKLITKEEPLDRGSLFIKKGLSIGYLKQIPESFEGSGTSYLMSAFTELHQMLDEMKQLEQKMMDPACMEKALKKYGVLQDQFTEKGGYEMESMIQQVAHGLKVSHLLEQPISRLSGGERTKLSLAKILLEKPDVLLLDEPTNHLDLHAIEWLEKYLREYKGAVCIISHDREFLDAVVHTIVDVESGDTERYKGNYSSFEKQKEEKLLAEFQQYQEQQKKIKKMKEAIRRLRQWANEANPPNPKLFKKAKSMERAMERMEKIDRPVIDPKRMNLSLEMKERSGGDVLIAENVGLAFDDHSVLEDVSLHLRFQDRLAVVGTNGSGKSTFIKVLLGELSPDDGEVKQGSSIKVGYLPQHPLKNVDEGCRLIDHFREHVIVTEGQARHILAGFMFYGYDVFTKIGHLSGGERMRLQLAIFMHMGINLLVLDEPTNHLDIESQEVLEEALKGFEGTVIGVSHDRYFLNQCFDETAYLVDGRLYRYLGSYQETKSHWEQLLEESLNKKEKKVDARPHEEQQPSLSYEEQIVNLESELALEQKENKKRHLQTKIDKLYELWLKN